MFFVQLGEFESSLTLYDDTIGPIAFSFIFDLIKLFCIGGGFLPLCDWSALLMRLQLEGVDIGDRDREQAVKWKRNKEDFVSLFYDGHTCFTNLMAGDTVANTKLMDNMREYIRDDRKVYQNGVMSEINDNYL